MAVHCEALEAIALCATIFVSWAKLLKLNKGLIVVFLLWQMLEWAMHVEEMSHLSVLARNLDVIVFTVLVVN